jgi:aerobic-type carbon monoxide dehydrogenase small subunit (CoxS/CutS family)
MKTPIRLTLNGERRTLEVLPNDTLLEALRERAGLRSPKCGCDRGDCGTCTVLLDGKAVRSCLILAVEADGHDVTTVEGLSKDGPTSLQRAFIEHNAFQCGFCAPGMVVAATELLRTKKKPRRHEIREALGGHLCRCTGYLSIIEAIEKVGEDGNDHGKGGS